MKNSARKEIQMNSSRSRNINIVVGAIHGGKTEYLRRKMNGKLFTYIFGGIIEGLVQIERYQRNKPKTEDTTCEVVESIPLNEPKEEPLYKKEDLLILDDTAKYTRKRKIEYRGGVETIFIK